MRVLPKRAAADRFLQVLACTRKATVRHSDLVILGILSAGPRHGYELVKEIEAMNVRAWAKVGPSTVYRAIQRLEERGDLRGRAEREGARPERRVYEVTPRGRERLSALVRGAIASSEALYSDRLVGAVFAFHTLGRDEAEGALNDAQRQLLAAEERIRAALEEGASRYGEAILRFYGKLTRAEQEALAEIAEIPRVTESPSALPGIDGE